MPQVTTRYERAKLYEEIWKQPVREVAKAYGVSDTALKKVCDRLKVPRPSNRYWARKAAGHAVQVDPLPALMAGDPVIHETSRWVYPPPEPPSPEEVAFRARPEFQLRAVELPFEIEIQSALDRPLKAVAVTLKALRKAKPARDGLVAPHGVDGLPVQVGVRQVERAIRFLDALIKGVEKAGHRLVPNEGYGPRWRFVVDGEDVQFSVRERLKQTPHIEVPSEFYAPKWDHQPTGELRFDIEYDATWRSKQRWEDSPRATLESQVNHIFKTILEIGPHQKARQAERDARERQRHEEHERRRIAEQKAVDARRAAEAIVEMAQKWDRARVLREFVEVVRLEATKRFGVVDPDSSAAQWLQTANAVADSIDPMLALFAQPAPNRPDTES